MLITAVDKWPLELQFAALLGACIAGAWVWIRGLRAKPVIDLPGSAALERLALLERQNAELTLRHDLEDILRAQREALDVVIDALDERLSADVENLRRDVHKLELRIERFPESRPRR